MRLINLQAFRGGGGGASLSTWRKPTLSPRLLIYDCRRDYVDHIQDPTLAVETVHITAASGWGPKELKAGGGDFP